MRAYRILLAALMMAVVVPAAAEAQVSFRVLHRGMLGIMTEVMSTPGEPARHRVIIDVVPDSPADRAGVLAGDTLLTINGTAATEKAMITPFEPGDTVVLRVRRDGREQDIAVVASERMPQYASFTVNALPDSIQKQVEHIMDAVRIEMDAVRSGLDTLRTGGFRIERMRGDSAIVFRFGDDSVRVQYPFDSTPDGRLIMRVPPGFEGSFEADSILLRAQVLGERARLMMDSLPDLMGRERIIMLGGDTIAGMRAGDIFASGMTLGMRAVAGAELSELNPGLAEYFGVGEGVLVLNAREGTPAARAGIRAGDVIVQVNGARVASIAELRRQFGAEGPGSAVQIRVLRHGQPVDVSLTR